MAIPAQKNYEQYLPDKASVGIIEYMTKSVIIDGKTTTRKYFNNTMFNLYYEDFAGRTIVKDPTLEYAETTYITDDEVQINQIGLKFKYGGVEDLIIDATNFNEKHPLAKDEDNLFKNSKIWFCMGVIDELKPFDGSSSSSLCSADKNIVVERKQSSGYPANDGCSINIFFKGGKANIKTFEYYLSDPPLYSEYLAHESDHEYIDRVSIKDMTYETGISVPNIHKVEVTIKSLEDRFITQNIPYNLFGNVSVGSICYTTWHSLGSQLIGQTQNRVSEFKTVISDNIEKQIVVKSYDVFDGHIRVDEAGLQKAEYILAKATAGDYVFHIGCPKEIYGQRVYLCKLKYNSPIEDTSKIFKIKVNGQSLAYDIENPLVAQDSTDGYPV